MQQASCYLSHVTRHKQRLVLGTQKEARSRTCCRIESTRACSRSKHSDSHAMISDDDVGMSAERYWGMSGCALNVARHTSHVTRHTSHVTRHTSHVARHTSHVTRHTSHVTRHTSHVTRHTSHVTRHTSHVTPRTSHVTRHTSHVTRHTSHVTRHTSHVTRHTSHVTRPTSSPLFPLQNLNRRGRCRLMNNAQPRIRWQQGNEMR
jgi:hypothetical protein